MTIAGLHMITLHLEMWMNDWPWPSRAFVFIILYMCYTSLGYRVLVALIISLYRCFGLEVQSYLRQHWLRVYLTIFVMHSPTLMRPWCGLSTDPRKEGPPIYGAYVVQVTQAHICWIKFSLHFRFVWSLESHWSSQERLASKYTASTGRLF